ncbi:MAG TPA: hypothetical protein VK776_22425 [Bryobacteraceae bacterium]|nr:hypothetical protein [Bryobacteraceae bacterium]
MLTEVHNSIGGVSSVPQNNAWSYSPHPDRQRFLVTVSTATDQPTVNVILHWQRAVAAQMKADQR